jgi:hypothetical protein
MKPATLVLQSSNAKIGRVAATYASIASTCPTSCSLKGEGCYAQSGNVAFTVRRLDKDGASPEDAALYEASLLDAAKTREIQGLPLRLHVSGDARTPVAAELLSRAAERWMARGGGPVWSYTHAWRDVPRDAWGAKVAIFASVQSTAEGAEARAAGYVPAVVVERHPVDGRAHEENGVKYIPCPSQTRGKSCVECRLCFDTDALASRGAGISFAAHGSGTKRALKVLS